MGLLYTYRFWIWCGLAEDASLTRTSSLTQACIGPSSGKLRPPQDDRSDRIGAFHESFRHFETIRYFCSHLRCRRAIFSARANNTRQGCRPEKFFACKVLEKRSKEAGAERGAEKRGEERRDDGRHFCGVEIPSDWAGSGFGARDVDCSESEE